MEDVLCKASSTEILNESMSPNVEKEDLLNVKAVISAKMISPVKDENLGKVNTEVEEKANYEVNSVIRNDFETPINGESTEAPEFSTQRKFSPTLIESAFNIMKNLFSPDKTKSKSTSILNPNSQPLSSGSPSNNMCKPGNTELFSSEPETEIQFKVQPSGENILKNSLQNDDLGIMQSPFSLEPLNNTDESFLTTVSLIDESFHSAVTHFDEHGDIFRSGVNLMENILDSSQNLDLMDPYNDTLENNESLENTTLKLGNFTSEGNKINNVLIQSEDKNIETLNNPQVNTEISNLNGSEKVQYEEFKELQEKSCSSSLQNGKELNSDVGVLMTSDSKRESSQDVDHQESLNAVGLPANSYQEIKSTCEVEASHLFLNKSFEKHMSESETGLSSDERDFYVENSISTTTVVLRTVDSVIVDNMLLSLKADDSETNTSSVTSFDSDDVTSSLENMTGKVAVKEPDSTPFKQSSESDSCTSENCFSLMDEKKACISEMNPLNNKPDCTKITLDKCDEMKNCKSSNECSERQNEKDSSVDILLMKNNEASENTKLLHPYANVTQTQAFKEHNQAEIDKNQEGLHLSKADAVPIISQQSYTILTTHDNSLNRPVIGPLNISNGHFEKETFQLNQSSATSSAEYETVEKHSANNCPNASFGTEELAKSQLKQSTPLWEKHNESSQKFFRPDSLKLNSPGLKVFPLIFDSFHDNEMEKKSNYTKPDLLVKAKEIFHHEGQIEFSPVNPIGDNELLLSNSVENGGGENSNDLYSTKILQSKSPKEPNQGFVKQLRLNESKKSPENSIRTLNRNSDKTPSSEPKNMKQTVCKSPNSPTAPSFNQTFEKKSKLSSVNNKNQSSDTSKHNKLNNTFDRQSVSPKKNFNKKAGTPEVEKANQTFTKKKGSPEINSLNRTFERPESPKPDKLNKTYEKPSGNNELNRTFDKKTDGQGSQILNQIFDKKSGSPLPCERTQIIDKTCPDVSQNNQTFCKKTDFSKTCLEKRSQGMSETYESFDVGKITEIKECNVSTILETKPVSDTCPKVGNLLTQENKTFFVEKTSTFDALNPLSSDDQTSLNTDFISSESLDRTNKNFALGNHKDINDSFASTKSSSISLGCSDLSTVLLNEDEFSGNQSTDELLRKLEKMDLNENCKHAFETPFDTSSRVFSEITSIPIKSAEEQNLKIQEKLMSPAKDEKIHCDSDIVQLIQEQFSLNDIEKICTVAHQLTSMKLNTDPLKTNVQSVTPFQENISETKFSEVEMKSDNVNALSPKSFDFLSSIRGKPTGRDLSRESLYVKFDPLVQPSANSLIDFTKEGEQLAVIDASPGSSHNTSVCEKLLTISPQKKASDIVPPLTPLSDKMKTPAKEDKIERLKELQNEIYFLKNLFAERERLNRTKMEDYESQIAKLTGESCMLEDKLKESSEREKSLVKKMKEQTQSISQLHVIMEEYSKVISKLTAELDVIKKENQKQIESLSLEKDSYMTHLQNTEAAFTDVHTKYEKSKKTIVNLKANEAMYRNTIAEQTQKLEEFKVKAKEVQEKAFLEFQKIQEQLNETKTNHTQEAARLRALLRKTELKVEALQESLDQKLKENQQLTAICDELIEGKK